MSVEIPAPLSTCIIFCEVECVRACCGIDAISTDPALIEAWCRQVGSVAVVEARLQLAELIEVVDDRSHRVTSTFLNHRTTTTPRGVSCWTSWPPSTRDWRPATRRERSRWSIPPLGIWGPVVLVLAGAYYLRRRPVRTGPAPASANV
ncbi:DUF6331 family protein [Micromonospora echinaurantiaca]|uniref:DUF6331 family protein n=1 Tax=Micromonospora echinaurantiaca TaxID=47857 RepID=UPI0037B1C151